MNQKHSDDGIKPEHPKEAVRKDSVHKNHRLRLKKRFLQQGLASFEEHNAIELLLFFGIPFRDTNEEAHLLLETFGSLVNVLDAPYEELIKVKGISEHSATLLKLIPQFCSRYYDTKALDAEVAPENLVDYLGQRLKAKYISELNEVPYLICLDNRLRILYFGKMGEGSNDCVSINTRKIIEIAIRCNATNVILAHNHPIGLVEPSSRDRMVTRQLYHALASASLKLLDHIIVSGGDYYSMAARGMLSPSMMGPMRSGSSLGDTQRTVFSEEEEDWNCEEP